MTAPAATRSRSEVRRALGSILEGHRGPVAGIAAAAFVGGLAEAAFLVVVTRTAFAITDDQSTVALGGGWAPGIGVALGLSLALVVARLALATFSVWRSSRLTSTVVAALRRDLAGAFLHADWEKQQTQNAGTLQELVVGYANQATNLMNGLGQGIVAAANLVGLLGLAIAVDPGGAAVMVLVIGVLGAALRPVRSLVRRRARRATADNLALATSVNELAHLGMELHAFGVQDAAERRLAERIEAARGSTRRLLFATSSSTTAYVGLAYLALVGALAAVAASSSASLTTLGAVMLVMLRSLSYGQGLQSAYVNISAGVPAIDAIAERLAHFRDGRRSAHGHAVADVGVVEMDDVHFAYPGGVPVLADVSFQLAPREVVGIVGPSGSGKSTLVQLLLGLRRPQRGAVRADGIDLAAIDPVDWARRVAFVPQGPKVLAGSIADNIRFLRDGITDDQVVTAARLASLHDEIVAHPEGYGRSVGEQGSNLSGGQLQRLCIARALVARPDVLILDEPTSALDVASEQLIRATLRDLGAAMTIVVIAHRLSTLDICDRIMVVQHGRIVAFDTPEQLERGNDFYREALVMSGLR